MRVLVEDVGFAGLLPLGGPMPSHLTGEFSKSWLRQITRDHRPEIGGEKGGFETPFFSDDRLAE